MRAGGLSGPPPACGHIYSLVQYKGRKLRASAQQSPSLGCRNAELGDCFGRFRYLAMSAVFLTEISVHLYLGAGMIGSRLWKKIFLGLTAALGLLALTAGPAAAESGVTVLWEDGFRIVDKQDEHLYYLRLRLGFQFRYTYGIFDDCILSNAEHDWSNFFLRRARLFADGNAPNRDWYYFFQVQLEPQAKVNLTDAYVRWQKLDVFRIWLGRGKIPYGLEFWQSGFAQNGVERTIFTGETDSDGKAQDVFGDKILRFWPGGNALFPVSGHVLEGTLYPVGGMTLYRSQGVYLEGDVPVPGFGGLPLFQYWAGVFNGRDTQGFANDTADMLYSLRLAYAPFGETSLTVQGDLPTSQRLKAAFLFSTYYYKDEADLMYDSVTEEYVVDRYDIQDYGFNLAALFRYRGFSADLEFANESFDQLGDLPDNSNDFERLGGRINLGYFLLPDRFEVVFKWAYLERIHDNDEEASLQTGLGLVETCNGTAVEKYLQQYTVGLNLYLHGNNQKIATDYSLLTRGLEAVDPGGPNVQNQLDHRFRLMFQLFF